MYLGVNYYVDEDGVLYVEIDGAEIDTEFACAYLTYFSKSPTSTSIA